MLIIPAIDIKGGACVRLLRGDPSQATVYSPDPVEMARQWFRKGARRIHVVDLDGAFEGKPKHLDLVARMRQEVDCEIELGGGLRDADSLRRALDLGIDKLVLGTAALEDPGWFLDELQGEPERFIVGLDARDGRVAKKGWQAADALTLDQALTKMEKLGFRETVYTDIDRDGTLEGPNLASLRDVVGKTAMGVYASGGVSSLEDVRRLGTIPGLRGVVIGKALYAGQFTLEECLAL